MHSARSFAAMSALVGSALAQTPTVTSLYLYGFEADNLVASVVAAAPAATTYFVECAPGTDSTDCGFGPGVTFIEGPSTLGLHFTEDGAFSMDVGCAIASQTATCVETDAGPEANFPGTSTLSFSDLSDSMTPVTVTAGLDLLSGAAASATASGTASGSGGSTAATAASTGASATETSATRTASSSSASKTATSSSSTASASSTATGAAGRMDRNLVLAGVAGAAGLAMAL